MTDKLQNHISFSMLSERKKKQSIGGTFVAAAEQN